MAVVLLVVPLGEGNGLSTDSGLVSFRKAKDVRAGTASSVQ